MKTKQIELRFNKDMMARFGITPLQISSSLRASVLGSTPIRINEGNKETEVRIKVSSKKNFNDVPDSLDDIRRILIKTPTGNFVRLSQVADMKFSSELSVIPHFDGQRIITVSAKLDPGRSASEFSSSVSEAISELPLLPDEVTEIGGGAEEGRDLIKQVSMAMAAGFLLIFFILIIQFNSFSQSFIILATIPLSLTGVFFGLYLGGLKITFPAMIGIVALAGIIVNDGIVLLDRFNQNYKKNLPKPETIALAARERFQPIFITSITTVAGMIPLMFSDPLWVGLGASIVFGMSLSTVLCLIIVPCFLAFGKDKRNIK